MTEQWPIHNRPFAPQPGAIPHALDHDCTCACNGFFAVLTVARRLDAQALNLNTQSLLILLNYYLIPLTQFLGLPGNRSNNFTRAYNRFNQLLNIATRAAQAANGPQFNANATNVSNSTATELLLRLLLEKAPRTPSGNPSITTIGKPRFEPQIFIRNGNPR